MFLCEGRAARPAFSVFQITVLSVNIARVEQLLLDPKIIALIIAWVLPWKGVALWKAARLHHKGWFTAILILNTLAILEIVYIFFVAKKASLALLERPEIVPEIEN
jgi:hypothetical protein